MDITNTSYKRCVLISVNGRVDSGSSPKLGEALNQVQEAGHYKIVLDLKDVDYMSSSGLWVLVNAQKASRRYNRGEIVLTSVPPRIHSALDLAGFIPFFKIYDDITAAVGSF